MNIDAKARETPIQRAIAIYDEWNENPSMDLIEAIAAALHTARNEALEKAAKLEAEIERLKQEAETKRLTINEKIEEARLAIESLEATMRALLDENEAWREAFPQCEFLDGSIRTKPDEIDVRKVMSEQKERIQELEDYSTALRKENERLAGALERIHNNHALGFGVMTDGHADLDEIAAISRRALSGMTMENGVVSLEARLSADDIRKCGLHQAASNRIAELEAKVERLAGALEEVRQKSVWADASAIPRVNEIARRALSGEPTP